MTSMLARTICLQIGHFSSLLAHSLHELKCLHGNITVETREERQILHANLSSMFSSPSLFSFSSGVISWDSIKGPLDSVSSSSESAEVITWDSIKGADTVSSSLDDWWCTLAALETVSSPLIVSSCIPDIISISNIAYLGRMTFVIRLNKYSWKRKMLELMNAHFGECLICSAAALLRGCHLSSFLQQVAHFTQSGSFRK